MNYFLARVLYPLILQLMQDKDEEVDLEDEDKALHQGSPQDGKTDLN